MKSKRPISKTRWQQIQIERRILEWFKQFPAQRALVPEIDDYLAITLRGQAFHISKSLETLMAKREVDVVSLAWQSQVSEATIYKVRGAKRLPRLETLLKLAQPLDASVVLTVDPFGTDGENRLDRRTLVLHSAAFSRLRLMYFLGRLRNDGQPRNLIALLGAISASTLAQIEESPQHRANWESIFRLCAGSLYRLGVHLSDNQEYRSERQRGTASGA